MLLLPSLSTVRLKLTPDIIFLIYPFALLVIVLVALKFSNTPIWLDALLILACCAFLYKLSRRYIFLNDPSSIVALEYREQWVLHFLNGKKERVELDNMTVYTSFMLFLVFKSKKRYSLILRRSSENTAQFDALYVYLSKVWQEQ